MEIRVGFPLAVGVTPNDQRDPLTGLRLLVIVENPNPDAPDQPQGGGVRILVPIDDAQADALREGLSPVALPTLAEVIESGRRRNGHESPAA